MKCYAVDVMLTYRPEDGDHGDAEMHVYIYFDSGMFFGYDFTTPLKKWQAEEIISRSLAEGYSWSQEDEDLEGQVLLSVTCPSAGADRLNEIGRKFAKKVTELEEDMAQELAMNFGFYI